MGGTIYPECLMTEIKVFAGFDSDSRILYVFKKRPLKVRRELAGGRGWLSFLHPLPKVNDK
jgi:hypothetical protein